MKSRSLVCGVAFAVALAAGSCSSNPSQMTLASCVSGWFVVPPSDSCRVVCMAASPSPECAHNDCVVWDFRGYLAGNVYFGGLITYSAEGGTMSTAPSAFRGTYTVTEPTKKLTLDPPGQEYAVSCASSGFSANQIPQAKAPAELATALQQAFDAGSSTWLGAQVRR